MSGGCKMWDNFKFAVAQALSKHIRERGVRLLIWELVFFNIVCDDVLLPGYRSIAPNHVCWYLRKVRHCRLCDACYHDWQEITKRVASSFPRP